MNFISEYWHLQTLNSNFEEAGTRQIIHISYFAAVQSDG